MDTGNGASTCIPKRCQLVIPVLRETELQFLFKCFLAALCDGENEKLLVNRNMNVNKPVTQKSNADMPSILYSTSVVKLPET